MTISLFFYDLDRGYVYYPSVNVYITMENHHFYGKSTINTIYTKVSSEPPDRIENCDFVPVEHWN
jgi:hypothetical protein